jgi:hypothetical protein
VACESWDAGRAENGASLTCINGHSDWVDFPQLSSAKNLDKTDRERLTGWTTAEITEFNFEQSAGHRIADGRECGF